MPRLTAALLVFALAAPLSAQTHLADSSGVYLGLGGGYASSGYFTGGVDIGYRQSNGLDYGLSFATSQSAPNAVATLSDVVSGVTVGQTIEPGLGTALRLEGMGFNRSLTGFISDDEPGQYSANVLGADVSAALSRPIRIGGSFRIAPSAGVYATTSRTTSEFATGRFVNASPSGSSAGLQLGVTLSFRFLGTDVSLPFTPRFSLAGDRRFRNAPALTPSTGLRINF